MLQAKTLNARTHLIQILVFPIIHHIGSNQLSKINALHDFNIIYDLMFS